MAQTLREKVIADIKGLREVDAIDDEAQRKALAYLDTDHGIRDMAEMEKDGCRVSEATELVFYVSGSH